MSVKSEAPDGQSIWFSEEDALLEQPSRPGLPSRATLVGCQSMCLPIPEPDLLRVSAGAHLSRGTELPTWSLSLECSGGGA